MAIRAENIDEAKAEEARQRAEARLAGTDASAFPVPPLDLPHYHGVGLDAGVGIEAGTSPSGTSPKEVTGA